MKRLLPIMILTSLFALSSCAIHAPQNTSSGRAAYGNAVPDFKANKKQNQKRKKKARRGAKRNKSRNNSLYFHGRPY